MEGLTSHEFLCISMSKKNLAISCHSIQLKEFLICTCTIRKTLPLACLHMCSAVEVTKTLILQGFRSQKLGPSSTLVSTAGVYIMQNTVGVRGREFREKWPKRMKNLYAGEKGGTERRKLHQKQGKMHTNCIFLSIDAGGKMDLKGGRNDRNSKYIPLICCL